MKGFDPDYPTPVLDAHADRIAGALIFAGRPMHMAELCRATGLDRRQVRRILLHRPCERHSFRFKRDRRTGPWYLAHPERETDTEPVRFVDLASVEGVARAAREHGITMSEAEIRQAAALVARLTIRARPRRRGKA